jgi:hypothetical protein
MHFAELKGLLVKHQESQSFVDRLHNTPKTPWTGTSYHAITAGKNTTSLVVASDMTAISC